MEAPAKPAAVRLDEFAIISGGDRGGAPPRVLKQGDTFGVFDLHGDAVTDAAGEHGVYHEGTRFLSRLELRLGRRRPLLLGSRISDDNTVLAVDLTNPDVVRDGKPLVRRGALHLFRTRLLWDGQCLERIRLANHALHPIALPLTLVFDADYVDLFEVRGTARARRGRLAPPVIGTSGALLRYEGLDGVERRTRLEWSRVADRVEDRGVTFSVSLEPREVVEVELAVAFELGAASRPSKRYDASLASLKGEMAARQARECGVVSSNESFNRWLRRSSADLRMMMTDTPSGTYPYAGIPWYSTPFGRDGLVTALEMLWAAPEVARGVLAFLAETQATTVSEEQDAQPGKIIHEIRAGEMAALGEIPFGRYYGSVDATPLFVMLAHAFYERTADRPFLERLWPHLLSALHWMETYGDPDGDLFLEYARQGGSGLLQQGWKDSNDSIFHEDGELAEPPIALCEVQGYAYGAWAGAAALAEGRGDFARARQWRDRAATLRERFDEAFWCEDAGDVRAGAGRSKTPVPGADVEPRPLPVQRHRLDGSTRGAWPRR